MEYHQFKLHHHYGRANRKYWQKRHRALRKCNTNKDWRQRSLEKTVKDFHHKSNSILKKPFKRKRDKERDYKYNNNNIFF